MTRSRPASGDQSVPRGDFAQLAVQVFDRDLALAENAQERRHRHIGDTEPLGQLLKAFDWNAPLVQDVVDGERYAQRARGVLPVQAASHMCRRTLGRLLNPHASSLRQV